MSAESLPDTRADQSGRAVLISLGLIGAAAVAVSALVGGWVVDAWRQSPMDRQALLFLLLLVPWFGFSRRVRVARARLSVWLSLSVILAVLSFLLGLIADIHLAQALALPLLSYPLLRLLRLRHASALAAALIIFLALPTTAYLFGQLVNMSIGEGLRVGVGVKWAVGLGAFAVLHRYLSGREAVILSFLALVAVMLVHFITHAWTPDPQTHRFLGTFPWAAFYVALPGLLIIGGIYKWMARTAGD